MNTPDIGFYYSDDLNQNLIQLLKAALRRNQRVVVSLDPEADIQGLDRVLWTYDPASFLPHGYLEEDSPLDCPIWLTREEKNLNQGTVLIGFDYTPREFESYQKVCFIRSQPLNREELEGWGEFCREKGYSLSYHEKKSGEGWRTVFRSE